MIITLKKISEDGLLREYILNVEDAWWDPLYNRGGVKVIGAVRLVLEGDKEFHITGLHDPKWIVQRIKERRDLILDANHWDPPIMEDSKAFKLCYTSMVDRADLVKAAKKIRYIKEFLALNEVTLEQLSKKISLPVQTLDILRRTLPTPGKPAKVSKFQYFNYLYE